MTIPARITVDDLATRKGDVVLLDVRTPAEFDTAHMPGSINAPVDLVERDAAAVATAAAQDVVLICRAGPRAERAQQALARAGLTNTAVLTGGFEAWRDGGQAVEYGEARWDLERQVRLVAGSLVASGVLASTVVPKAKWLSGAVGGGLVFAALSNTCAMGNLLGRLPYNRGAGTPTLEQVTARLQ